MNTAPAVLPLPGGEAGATVGLHPLDCGRVKMPERWVHSRPGVRASLSALGIRTPREELLDAPIIAFLLVHPTAGPILVDTGFPAEVARDPGGAIGRFNARIFRGLRVEPTQTVSAQVRSLGIHPEEVRLVVMTHLHVDHAGALPDFPAARVVVSEPEWKAATARGSAFAGYHRAHLDLGLDFRLYTFPEPLGEGARRFDRSSLDLLGDGSIRLIPTPGHTPGHVSVLVRTLGGEALIAGDAIYTGETLRRGERPFRAVDREAYERSVEALSDYRWENPDALIIPGHDLEAWNELRAKVPA